MTKKVFNMEGGLHSAAAYSAFENRLYGSVKATAADFIVTAGTGMNAIIAAGDGLIDTGQGFARRIQSDAQETVSIAPANTSYKRIDSIVVYIDNSVAPTTSVIDNTNGILKFASVTGTAASSPQAPNQASIQATIGAGNPYLVLASITVPTNATNLTGATFDNTAPTPLLKNYPIGAIFMSANSTNPQSLFGGRWQAYAQGRTLFGFDSADADFNTGGKVAGAKSHTHGLSNGYAELSATGGTLYISRKLQDMSYTVKGSVANLTTETGTTDRATGLGGNTNSASQLPPYIVTYLWQRIA